MECRKRGTSVASATSKFACCRMCARLQDHCDGSVLSSRLLLRQQRKEYKQTEKPLLPVSLEATHVGSAGLAGRTRPLARHAPAGACHQQGASRRRSGICRLDPTLANGPDMSIRLSGRPTLRAGSRRSSAFSPSLLVGLRFFDFGVCYIYVDWSYTDRGPAAAKP